MSEHPTRQEISREVRRLLTLSAGADEPAASELMTRANDLAATWDLDWIDCLPPAPRHGHPLLRLSAGRIDADLCALREAICWHVRIEIERKRRPDVDKDYLRYAVALGPRWRRGSNSWRPNTMRILRDEREPETPCPACGADGDQLGGANGYEACSACGAGFAVGDYAWDNLSDVLRFEADASAGNVEDNDRCRQCDRVYDQAMFEVHMHQDAPFCSVTGCPWGGDLPRFDSCEGAPE